MIKKFAFILTIIAAVAIGTENIVANADDGDNNDNLSEALEEMLNEIDFSEFEKYIDELGGITDVVPDVKAINERASDNDVILLKGSHSMQLEKLVPLLCGAEGEAR